MSLQFCSFFVLGLDRVILSEFNQRKSPCSGLAGGMGRPFGAMAGRPEASVRVIFPHCHSIFRCKAGSFSLIEK